MSIDGSPSARGAPPRPVQVTRAAWQGIIGSAIGIILMATAVGRINSKEMQDVADQVRKQPMIGRSLSLDEALNLIKLSAIFGAAVCVVSLVFSVYVLRRHRASRIGLTVIGTLTALSGLVQAPTGLVITAYIAISLYLLWTPPARAWFAWKPGMPVAGPPAPGAGTRPPPPPR